MRCRIPSGQRGHADREYENAAFEYGLKMRGGAQKGQPVEPDREDQDADQRADDMEFAFAQGCRAEEDCGKRVQEVAVADAECSAAKKGGEKRAGYRRAEPGGCGRRRIPPSLGPT